MKLTQLSIAIGLSVASVSVYADAVPATETTDAGVSTSVEASAPVQVQPQASVVAAKAAPTTHNWLGAYLVGQFGQGRTDVTTPDTVVPGMPAQLDGDGNVITPAVPDTTIAGKTQSDSSAAYRLGAGYRINRIVSVEAAYIDVGTYNLDGTKIEGSGFSLGAALSMPLSFIYGSMEDYVTTEGFLDRTSLYVRGDAVNLNIKDDSGNSERNTTPSFAVGFESNLPKGFAVRGEYSKTKIKFDGEDENVEIVSIGLLKSL